MLLYPWVYLRRRDIGFLELEETSFAVVRLEFIAALEVGIMFLVGHGCSGRTAALE
jgi:hypothetical protein